MILKFKHHLQGKPNARTERTPAVPEPHETASARDSRGCPSEASHVPTPPDVFPGLEVRRHGPEAPTLAGTAQGPTPRGRGNRGSQQSLPAPGPLQSGWLLGLRLPLRLGGGRGHARPDSSLHRVCYLVWGWGRGGGKGSGQMSPGVAAAATATAAGNISAATIRRLLL